MLRARGRGGGTEVWSSRALEVCCRRVDVAVLRYEDLKLRRHATGLETGGMEIWSSGGVLRARGRGGTWRYGGMEMRCRRVDVEV